MNESPTPATPLASASTARAILLTGLVAGLCDGTAAVVNYTAHGGTEPVKIAYYIASALFGRETAYAGGWPMAMCGILMHLAIAMAWTALYYLVYPQVRKFAVNSVVTAVVYGAFVWVMMNLVLVPLTRVPKGPFNPGRAAIEMGILMLCIGLPISLLARRHYAKK